MGLRKLTKNPKPKILVENEVQWRKEYQTDRSKTRYRHREIRQALEDECAKKCAYCESFISHVAYSHIEHKLPKGKRPELVVSWENLTLACPKCNTNKGTYYNPQAPLLDPYQDDVHACITFNLGEIVSLNEQAKRTIERLDLRRSGLFFGRIRVISSVRDSVLRARNEPDTARRQRALALALASSNPDLEYTMSLRAYLKEELVGWPYPDDRSLIASHRLGVDL